ncbi:MAG: hypothetical protein LBB94_12920 [Clostridiales bacterium]|nr:hypothetical protein [Clostridiales bacterium]
MTGAGKTSGQNAQHIEKQLLQWGEGARAQVVVYWRAGGAHTFAAEVNKGDVYLLDPQPNKKGRLILQFR